jgi:hypothetical protein
MGDGDGNGMGHGGDILTCQHPNAGSIPRSASWEEPSLYRRPNDRHLDAFGMSKYLLPRLLHIHTHTYT